MNNITKGTVTAGGYLSFSYVLVAILIHFVPDLKEIEADLLVVVNIGLVFLKKIIEKRLGEI